MRTFENKITEEKFTNEFGETMHMVLNIDYKVYIHHTDCTEDFVELSKFNFYLNKSETAALNNFLMNYLSLTEMKY